MNCLREKVGRLGNDIWKFRVTLKDPSIHDVGENLTLRAIAETDYMGAQSNEHLFEDALSITSEDFTLSAEGQAVAGDYFRRLFRGETVGIDYICDGIELTSEQRKGIEVLGDYIIDPEKMQKKIRITNNGNIRLEYAPLYWFLHREDTVILRWNVAYTRWNTQMVQEVVIELKILYLPWIAQWVILFTALFSIAWVLLCAIKRFTHSFIEKSELYWCRIMAVRGFECAERGCCVFHSGQRFGLSTKTAAIISQRLSWISEITQKGWGMRFSIMIYLVTIRNTAWEIGVFQKIIALSVILNRFR